MKNTVGGLRLRVAVAGLGGLTPLAVLPGVSGCAPEAGPTPADRATLERPAGGGAPADAGARSLLPESAAPVVPLAASATAGPAATQPGRVPTGPAGAGLPASGMAAGRDTPVATVNGLTIPASELLQPLIEAHGLDMLLSIVQRDLAKQGADNANPPIVVTPDDFKAEWERTLTRLYQEADARIQDEIDKAEKANKPDEVKRWRQEQEVEHRQLLQQFYEQRKITPTEFDLVIQTNTYLRKIAEPKVRDRITEEMLHNEFAVRYGEKVRVRHIQLGRPQDYLEVKRLLAAGRRFEDLARDLSIDRRTGALGGQLPPFNREDPRLPKVFKEVAFDLKVGQVSDLVNADDTFHLIKLEERILPKAVVYEKQRDILYRDLHEQLVQGVVNLEREVIAEAARKSLKVTDPTMHRQFDAKLEERDRTIKGKEAAEQEMAAERDRQKLLMQRVMTEIAATRPSTRPGTTQPAATQPLATQPPAPPPPLVPPVPALPPAATRPLTAPPAAPVAPPAAPPAPVTRPAATQPATGGAARAARPAPALPAAVAVHPVP